VSVDVAIIGASFAKRAWLPAFRHIPAARVVALASRRLESARDAAASFGIEHAYDDWRAMLRAHPVDLVCVATPTLTHGPMTLASLEAGADVLCEKPMAMSAAEARAMRDRAVELGRRHVIDHELRFNPNRRKVRELIREGAVGDVRHVEIVNIGTSWADPAGRPENDWWSRADMGGGRLGAAGSHQIDLLRYWLGEVRSVSGTVETMVPERIGKDTGRPWTATADDYDRFTLRFESGALANVLLSGVARHGFGNSTRILGSEGTIVLPDDDTLLYGRPGEPLEDISERDPNADLEGIQQTIWTISVVALLKEFVAAIDEERSLRHAATFDDGLATQRAMDAIRTSSDEKRWIDIAHEEPA
jgi:predicted dehydrogenase